MSRGALDRAHTTTATGTAVVACTVIGDAAAADYLDRDGHPALAAIHRLTPAQACDALAFLSGYAPEATARALEDVTGRAVRGTTTATAPLVDLATGGYEEREAA